MNEATHYDLAGPGGPDSSDARRRQRNALIGLSVGSAVVLFLGIAAVLLTRSSDDRASVDSVGATSVVSVDTATSITPTSITPTSSSTTSSSTTSTTTTVPPVDAVANAGDDRAVDAATVVTLDAVEVTEGALDADVTWRQTLGPDVTAGLGALGGRSVSFGAPADVVTIGFDLVVDVSGVEATDSIVIRVFENADTAVFVDGDLGDDDADGTMESPLRTIAAGAQAAAGGADVHVRSGPVYVETDTVRLGVGTSLYGGFVDDWTRDVTRRVRIDAAPVAISVTGDGDRWLSALEVTGRDSISDGDAVGVRIEDGETITIADSRVVAGAAADGRRDERGLVPAGVSAGVVAIDTGEIRIERSTVNAGRGGDGVMGAAGEGGGPGGAGENGSGSVGGAGADAAGARRGGDGTDGDASGDAGGDGSDGEGAVGSDPLDDGEPGAGGAAGAGGRGGDGGVGTVAGDRLDPVGAAGRTGVPGASGLGGGGGDGGTVDAGPGPAAGGAGASAGGGGGGGGGGGDGGDAGAMGSGGGGSVGIWAADVDSVVVLESLVAAARGGTGGPGGLGGTGGDGGHGGRGGEAAGIAGGGGGGGGAGGQGGSGGGGAGGPSFGLLTDGVDEVLVADSTIRGGPAGAGANGGGGGADGGPGLGGVDRSGGDGGAPGLGDEAGSGVGASGGSSFGWFDAGRADARLERADFVEGLAGRGGDGSVRGEAGRASASTSG